MIANRLRAVLALALLVLAGHFIWEWQHTVVSQAGVRENPPALPVSPDRIENKSLEEILARNILDPDRGKVEDTVEATGSMRVDRQWHLLATAVQQVHEPVAVISARGKMKSVHEGDILPDGSRLVLVIEDGIIVEQAGKERHVYLFGKQ